MPGSISNPITVFHLTHPKSGSQWVYQVLDALFPHRMVYAQLGHTQFYDFPIQEGCIYPTLYVTRSEFESVKMPEHHRKFFVMRDLRDTLVSLYFSVRYSHGADSSGWILHLRGKMDGMTDEEGLEYTLSTVLQDSAKIQLSWLSGDVPIYRYEDAIKDPLTFYGALLDHCELKVSQAMLRNVVDAVSFKKKSGREPGMEDRASHYRRGVAGDWRNYLRGDLLEKFYARFGKVLVSTGYESEQTLPVPTLGRGREESPAQDAPSPRLTAEKEPENVRVQRRADCALLYRQWERSGPAKAENSLQQDRLITGTGWYPVEQHEGQSFCWVADEAELTVRRPSGHMQYLQLDLEPGPAAGTLPMKLWVMDGNGSAVTGAEISSRQVITLDLTARVQVSGEDWALTFLVVEAGAAVAGDHRTMCYRVFRFGWTSLLHTSGDAWSMEVKA